MLTLFGLLYLVICPLSIIFGSAYSLPLSVEVIASILLCCLLELAIVQIVRVYQPALKTRFAALVRLCGIRLMLLFTLAVGVGIAVLCIIYTRTTPMGWGVALVTPILGLTTLNLMGLEIIPKSLVAEPEPGKIVMPDVPPVPPNELETEIVQQYRWTFKDTAYAIRFVLRKNCYKEALAQARNLKTEQWSKTYITGGMCGEVYALAVELARLQQSFGTYEEVSFVLSFVQQVITYKLDVGEYPRYPIETLAEAGGDCEDSAILGAAVLLAMGYEVALLFLPGHCALGIAGASGMEGAIATRDGLQYFYCEMTAQGWKFGQMPNDFTIEQIQISPVVRPPAKIVKAS